MKDKVSVLLTMLVGAAGVVFAVTVMNLGWLHALLVAGLPPAALGLALATRRRQPDDQGPR